MYLTFVETCGLPAVKGLEGKSLASTLRQPSTAEESKVIYMRLINTVVLAMSLFAAVCFVPVVKADQLAKFASTRTVNRDSLTGKVMVGYQGWFNCDGDGSNLGWTHWARDRRRRPSPGNVTVDLWPDVSEFDPDERYATGFRHANGKVAEVFSSANRKTVLRHFNWMRDYSIDGAFVQRFVNELRRTEHRRNRDSVLDHVRNATKQTGRVYAVMYDLSGLPAGGVKRVIEDWKTLRTEKRVTADKTYLRHDGKPLVAVWGIGFNDRSKPRNYTLAECRDLVIRLRNGGCAVMLGVPTGWRELNRDSVSDSKLHGILKLADIISPWTPGRYANPKDVSRHAAEYWKPDGKWCAARQLDYMPVVFPGFSWHNLKGEKLGAIPRLKGQFFWSQMVAAKRSGARMIYVAMFDEVDEGTAIFKCTDNPPVGKGVSFLSNDGLPSDHYLWLTGQGGRLLRGELPMTERLPGRSK